MSKRKDERGENLLAVFVKASELLAYTIRAVCNETHFRARYRYENGSPCVDLARQIMHCVTFADAVVPVDDETRNARLAYQQEALRCGEALKAEIIMNVLHFGLNETKAKYWDALLQEWRELCLAWMRSDRRQYAAVGGGER